MATTTSILNIGLETSTRVGAPPVVKWGRELALAKASAVLGRHGFEIKSVAIEVASCTGEDTLVIIVEGRPFSLGGRDAIVELCEELNQEAIAFMDFTGEGFVEGPHAADWGEFCESSFCRGVAA